MIFFFYGFGGCGGGDDVSGGGGLVFNFVCGFGCDYGLWLKWWFNDCVGSGLVAVVSVW